MKEKEVVSSEYFDQEIMEVLREMPIDKFALLRNQEDASILRRYNARLTEIAHSCDQVPPQYRSVLQAVVKTYVQNAKQIWDTIRLANEDIDRGRRLEMDARAKFALAEKDISAIGEVSKSKTETSRGFLAGLFGKKPAAQDPNAAPTYLPVIERIRESLDGIKEGVTLQENARYRCQRAHGEFESILLELFSLINEHRREYWKNAEPVELAAGQSRPEVVSRESIRRGTPQEARKERVA